MALIILIQIVVLQARMEGHLDQVHSTFRVMVFKEQAADMVAVNKLI